MPTVEGVPGMKPAVEKDCWKFPFRSISKTWLLRSATKRVPLMG